jgi:transposase-like protein
MNKGKVYRKYSLAFKQQVVREYEGGASLHELKERYGIGGGNTVREWVEKYGRAGVRHKVMVIQSPAEQNQLKVMKEKIGQLEKVVAQLSLDKLMLETILEVAEAELGMELKKNGGRPSSNGFNRPGEVSR